MHAPLPDSDAVAHFLAAFAENKAEGPNVAFLENIIRKRVALTAPAPRAPRPLVNATQQTIAAIEAIGRSEEGVHVDIVAAFNAALSLLLARYRQNGQEDALPRPQHAIVDGFARLIYEDRAPEGEASPPAAARTEATEATAEPDARLREELARAHQWRFHLESGAREVLRLLAEMGTRPGPPTRAMFGSMVKRLREAVEWAP